LKENFRIWEANGGAVTHFSIATTKREDLELERFIF